MVPIRPADLTAVRVACVEITVSDRDAGEATGEARTSSPAADHRAVHQFEKAVASSQ